MDKETNLNERKSVIPTLISIMQVQMVIDYMSDISKDLKVFLFQNAPAPYRVVQFNSLCEKLDITVVYGTKATSDRIWKVGDIKYKHHFLNGNTFKIKGKMVTFAKGLRKYLNHNKYDCYVINDDLRCVFSNYLIIHQAKKNCKPIVLWCASIESEFRKQMIPKRIGFLVNSYLRYLVKNSSRFLAYGPKTIDYYTKAHFADKDKFIWGTQATSLTEEGIIKKENDCLNILYMGYLDNRKGIKDLINAVEILNTYNYKLTIAGKGKDEDELRLLAQNNEKIDFIGYIEGKEKLQCYKNADILVSPTYYDPWANTICEACAFSLPIATTYSEGAEGTLAINGYNAFIFSPGDVYQMEEILKYCILHKEELVKMGRRSKELSDKYSNDWVIDNMIMAIKNSLES